MFLEGHELFIKAVVGTCPSCIVENHGGSKSVTVVQQNR